jgi:hypothetical protein
LAIASEQITAPLTQGISLIIIFQEFSTDEFAKNPSLSSVLIDFAIEDIPSADPADQGTIQIVSSSQRQEIALKQVSHLV